MPLEDDGEQHHEQDEQAAWSTRTEVDLFTAPESPAAHHEKACEPDQCKPQRRKPDIVNRRTSLKMNDRGNYTCAGWNGHADEVLASRPAWIAWLRVDADIESRQTAGSADKKQKADHCTDMLHTAFDDGIAGWYDLAHSP